MARCAFEEFKSQVEEADEIEQALNDELDEAAAAEADEIDAEEAEQDFCEGSLPQVMINHSLNPVLAPIRGTPAYDANRKILHDHLWRTAEVCSARDGTVDTRIGSVYKGMVFFNPRAWRPSPEAEEIRARLARIRA